MILVPNVFPPTYWAGIRTRTRTMSFPELPVGGTRDQTKKSLGLANLSGGIQFQPQGKGLTNLDDRPFGKLLEQQTPYSATVTHVIFHTPLKPVWKHEIKDSGPEGRSLAQGSPCTTTVPPHPAPAGSPSRPVLLRYFFILWLYGNTDVVAPISAPMLQIVAMPGEKQSP